MQSSWQRMAGVVVALAGVGAALAWHAVATRRPAHRHEMVEELGSVLVFAGRPLPNHSGDKFFFLQYRTIGARTNDSWALYLQEAGTGRRLMADEVITGEWLEEYIYDQVRTFGWSPDDQFFAYARNKFRDVVVFDVSAEKPVAILETPIAFTRGAWISTNKLLCSDGFSLYLFKLQAGGSCQGPELIWTADAPVTNKLKRGAIDLLQPYNSTQALFKSGRSIYLTDGEGAPCVVWSSGWNSVFACSRDSRNVLVRSADGAGPFATLLRAKEEGENQFEEAGTERIELAGFKESLIRLVNRGAGWASLFESQESLNTLEFRTNWQSPGSRQTVGMSGEIKSFEASGRSLFVMGSMSNEPAGIWRYDMHSRASSRLASVQPRPFLYAISQPPQKGALTNAGGSRVNYHLTMPQMPSQRKKPPLVIGALGLNEKGYQWDRYAQTIVNCGFAFLAVERFDRPKEDWPGDVKLVYERMRAEGKVDTGSTYILGISTGTAILDYLLEEDVLKPRGIMLFSPASLPAPQKLRGVPLLIDMGGLETAYGTNLVRARTAVDQMARHGAYPGFYIRQGVGHNCRLLSIEKEKLHQLAAFLDVTQ